MEPLHISLVPQLENRTSALTKDAKLVNAYAEEVEKGRVLMCKRPGYTVGTVYEAGQAVQGITTYLGVVRAVVNNKLYTGPATSQALAAGGELVEFI